MEDGRTALGHRSSLGDNALKRLGISTSFMLDSGGAVRFRHVMGALPLAAGSDAPVNVAPRDGGLHATFAGGCTVSAPFDTTFLGG